MNAQNRCHSVDDLPLVLRVEDLAVVLGISRNSAYRLIRENQVRSIRVGSAIRIPRSAIIEFLTRPVV